MTVKITRKIEAHGSTLCFNDLCTLVDEGRAMEFSGDTGVTLNIDPGDRPFDGTYYRITVGEV